MLHQTGLSRLTSVTADDWLAIDVLLRRHDGRALESTRVNEHSMARRWIREGGVETRGSTTGSGLKLSGVSNSDQKLETMVGISHLTG